MLLILILFTVLLGLYPAPLLDGLHYNVYNLIFNIDSNSNPNIEIIQNLYLFSDIILYYNLDNIINSNIYDLIFDLDIKSIPDYDLHDLIFNPNTK
jgi:hypothetical protein